MQRITQSTSQFLTTFGHNLVFLFLRFQSTAAYLVAGETKHPDPNGLRLSWEQDAVTSAALCDHTTSRLTQTAKVDKQLKDTKVSHNAAFLLFNESLIHELSRSNNARSTCTPSLSLSSHSPRPCPAHQFPLTGVPGRFLGNPGRGPHAAPCLVRLSHPRSSSLSATSTLPTSTTGA